MIKLEIGKYKVDLPEQITIGQYLEYEKNRSIYVNNPSRVLSLFTGIPYDEMKKLPLVDIREIDEIIGQLMNMEVDNQLAIYITHNGKEYGLEKDFSKLSWGAWIDLDVYSQDILNSLHKILAILYRPIKQKKKDDYILEDYDSKDMEERATEFLSLPVSIWFGVSSFFFLIANSYIKDMEASLKFQMKMNKLIERGKRVIPKRLHRYLPQDSISPSLMSWQSRMFHK